MRAVKEGHVDKRGYHSIRVNNRLRYVHVLKAEKVLGRPLKGRELVHHVDNNETNNANSNLVICPDDTYHMLLHRRQRALEESGNADWLRCQYCGKHDKPENITIAGVKRYHRYHKECKRLSQKAGRQP